MNHLKILIPALISLVFGCRSGSDKMVDKFKEVNESLERSNKTIDSILLASDGKIDSTARDLTLIGFDPAVADSLGNLFSQTRSYIVHLKNELKNADRQGEDLDAAESLLIKTPKGDSLFKYLMRVYDVGIQYGDSISHQRLIDLRKYGKDKWLERYFKRIPTIAAITILSRFQNDLGHTKVAIMSAN